MNAIPAPRAIGRPALAVVRIAAEGDGVAYVARLLQRAFSDLGEAAHTVEFLRHSGRRPTALDQAVFLGRLTMAEAAATDWVMFGHLGLARAQRRVPSWWRKPYAVFLHGIEVWDPELAPDRRAALRGARLRVANSGYTARRVAAAHPDAGSVIACPLALHPDDRDRANGATAHALVERISARSVVIIGRMSAEERYKGHDELIECWPSVVARVPDAQLVVVGVGNDRERLMRKAADAQIAEHVLFTGFVDNPTRDAILARASVFAMPSRGEGFGIVYLQAMRAGTPCIGSSLDAAGDVIADGETGMLVDPAKREALAGAVVALLENDALRTRMGAAGRRRFEAEFTFDRFRDRLAGILAGAFGVASETH